MAMRAWPARVGAKSLYIEPGSPWLNGYTEILNGKLGDELLNGEVLCTLLEVNLMIVIQGNRYNTTGPHSSLDTDRRHPR